MIWSFDDGPNEHSTRQNMDVLEAHGIKGTFFLVGQHVERHPAIAREIHDRGHRVGNHSYSHPNLRTLSRDGVLDELVRCETAIIEARVPRPTVFRPPYGETDDQVELVALIGARDDVGRTDPLPNLRPGVELGQVVLRRRPDELGEALRAAEQQQATAVAEESRYVLGGRRLDLVVVVLLLVLLVLDLIRAVGVLGVGEVGVGEAHWITNQHDEPLVIIEVQRGGYTGEDDITRLDDDYGRVSAQ